MTSPRSVLICLLNHVTCPKFYAPKAIQDSPSLPPEKRGQTLICSGRPNHHVACTLALNSWFFFSLLHAHKTVRLALFTLAEVSTFYAHFSKFLVPPLPVIPFLPLAVARFGSSSTSAGFYPPHLPQIFPSDFPSFLSNKVSSVSVHSCVRAFLRLLATMLL